MAESGIRVRLRSVCRKTWEFESPHAHEFSINGRNKRRTLSSVGGGRRPFTFPPKEFTVSEDAPLAQLVEQLIYTEKAGGSSPSGCTL